ncbi:hypothetical protein [Pendulispora albinea]|uniref:M23 family metallopeptidase n=1 Tax=Pendulispora albinea TaxID=2741071 RepID=A0ABZ2MAA8_9BACT
MILSPPFLPPRSPNDVEDAFIDRAMSVGNSGDGSYPVSRDLNWHGGVHLTAPTFGNTVLPVRAIADGTVVFSRVPTPESKDMSHPLNHFGGWTDNGCVIIRHETDIGADPQTGAATSVVFFSIYMHLKSIQPKMMTGQRIFRKEELGAAGRIYGEPNKIHLEIFCDDANIERLVGPRVVFVPPAHDGRIDAVYGSMWFVLPQGSAFYQINPLTVWPTPPVAGTLKRSTVLRVDLGRGDSVAQSFCMSEDIGPPWHIWTPLGAKQVEKEFEYNLENIAASRFPTSSSAGYELLRFGRVLGPDALDYSDKPHWREILLPDPRLPHPGTPFDPAHDWVKGWVNLNHSDVRKFSDADFPAWDDWLLVDCSASRDSRCKELAVLIPLDADKTPPPTPAEIQSSLNLPAVRRQLEHRICRLQTEWDATTIAARFRWLTSEPRSKSDPQPLLDGGKFESFKAHAMALCFWQQAQLGIGTAHWHFHPRAFIRHFRKCGWLSLDELTQLMPRRPAPRAAPISFATARGRFQPDALALNRVLRKYNLLDTARQTHFLAQIYAETGLWLAFREGGRGRGRAYGPFYGRGLLQTTWAANFERYGTYRHFPPKPLTDPEPVYGDARITRTSKHPWGPTQPGGTPDLRQWFPKFDPEVVADNAFERCDASAFFWVSKMIGTHRNMNREADQDVTTQSVARISTFVNGGFGAFDERQAYAKFIYRYRGDDSVTSPTETFTVTHTFNGQTIAQTISVDYTYQRP